MIKIISLFIVTFLKVTLMCNKSNIYLASVLRRWVPSVPEHYLFYVRSKEKRTLIPRLTNSIYLLLFIYRQLPVDVQTFKDHFAPIG